MNDRDVIGRRTSVVAALLIMILATGAEATIRTWDGGPGGADTDWYGTANWNPDGSPGPADDLAINTGTAIAGTNVNIAGGSVSIGGGDVQWSGRFNSIGTGGNGTLTMTDGSLTVNYNGGSSHSFNVGNSPGSIGFVDQQGGDVIVTNNTEEINLGNGGGTGTWQISGGSLTTNHNIEIGNGTSSGTFKYVGADATVSVGANYLSQVSTSGIAKTVFELDGTARTIIAADRFVNVGNSTIEIGLATGASIATGTTFTLIESDVHKSDAWNASLAASGVNLVYDPADWNVSVTEGVAGTITAQFIGSIIPPASLPYVETFDALAADPQLEDNPGWVGNDTDAGDLRTVISAGPDRNVKLTATNNVFSKVYSTTAFTALDQDDPFVFSMNIEGIDYGSSRDSGRLTIGLRDSATGTNVLGLSLREEHNTNSRVSMFLEDWTAQSGNTNAPRVGATGLAELKLPDSLQPRSVSIAYDPNTQLATVTAYDGADLTGNSQQLAVDIMTFDGGGASGLSTFTFDSFFISQSQGSTSGTRVADFTIDDLTVVPEPASFMLFCLGVAAMALLPRRQRIR